MSSIDWGTAPAWLSAVGTVGSLSLTVRVVWLQVRDRRAELDEKLVSQARLVTAWTAGPLDFSGEYPIQRFTINNGSNQPVYNISLIAPVGVRGTYVRWIDAMGPTEKRVVRFFYSAPPGQML
ncbi:hypothetical protein GCM10029964_128340 [Kibdelosporangium lantanae]